VGLVNGAVLLSALLMGLLGSSHCALMCGGVSSALTGGLVTLGRQRPSPRLGLHVALSAGRVVTYTALGLALGGLGSTASALGGLRGVPLALRALAGIALVLVGLHLTGLVRAADTLERLGAPLWRRVAPLAKGLLPARSAPAAFVLGGVWGLMPCGLVYAALGLAAATGSARDGALTMALFGLGTAPALLAVGAFVKLLARLAASPWVRRLAGATVVVLGLVNVAAVAAMAGAGDTPGAPVCCVHDAHE